MLIQRLIDWLAQRRAVNILLALAYFVFLVLMHGPMVKVALWFQDALTFSVLNRGIEVLYLLFLILLTVVLWRQFKNHTANTGVKLFYLLSTITFIVIHSRFMFDSNMEVIHSLEFTFLAILFFPLTKRFGAAIMFTLPCMMLDELYQYWVLYPDFNDYFDLNDINMDLYGCGLAMTVILICGVKGQWPVKPLWRRAEFVGLIALSGILLLATLLCYISPYEFQKCGNTILVLNERLVTEPFWRQHPINLQWFHTMKPLEGFIMFNAITLFYFGLDSFRKA